MQRSQVVLQQSDDKQEFMNFNSLDNQLRRESFKQMKQWDDKKIQFLQFHDEMNQKIEQNLVAIHQVSVNANDKIMGFFHERVELDRQYYKARVQKLFGLFHTKHKKDQQNVMMYPKFQAFLKGVDDSQEIKKQKAQAINQFIQNSVIKQMNDEKNQYNKSVGQIMKQIQNSRKKLQTTIDQVNDISSNYTRHFFDAIRNEKKKNNKKCDLYLEKLKLYLMDKQQINLHRQIGEYVCDLWEILLTLEIYRLDFYKKIFEDMVQQVQKVGLDDFLSTSCYNSLKELQNVDDTEQSFQIDRIVGQDGRTKMKEYLKQEVDFNKIRQLLSNFKLEEIEVDPLVRKQYSIQKDVGTVSRDFKKAMLILTYEDGLIIQMDRSVSNFQIMNVMNVSLKRENKEMVVEILETKAVFIVDTVQKTIIRMESDKDVNDFLQTVDTIQKHRLQIQ